jgi:hypothetical protein
LSFPEGGRITNIERVDENWWAGEYDGQQGLFPCISLHPLPIPYSSLSPFPSLLSLPFACQFVLREFFTPSSPPLLYSADQANYRQLRPGGVVVSVVAGCESSRGTKSISNEGSGGLATTDNTTCSSGAAESKAKRGGEVSFVYRIIKEVRKLNLNIFLLQPYVCGRR